MAKEKMSDEEYLRTQLLILATARSVLNMNLHGFLVRIQSAHSLGPIVDPTLYKQAHIDLSKIEKLACALEPFARLARKLGEEEKAAKARGCFHARPIGSG